MDFKELLIFKTIYETNSLNKTAKILGSSQSNITAHLKKMEYTLKTVLFVRGYDGVTPTPAAKQFFVFATTVLKQFSDLKASLINHQTKVLISELLFRYIVIEKQQFSLDTHQFTIKRTDEMNQLIQQDDYDYVISFTKITHKDYQLFEKHHLPVCCLKSPAVKDITDLPIFVNDDVNCPLRALTLEQCDATMHLITVNSLNNLLQLIKTSRGYAFLPHFLIHDGLTMVDQAIYPISYYILKHNC